jgi:multicomponent Na+:H+ antiporter subunit G
MATATVTGTVLDVVAASLLVVGTAFTAIAAVGLFRMRDLYGRIHVATKPATLGVALTLMAAMLQVPFGARTLQLVVALVFQFWAIPAGSHMLGRAARAAGVAPAVPDVVDEYGDGDPGA